MNEIEVQCRATCTYCKKQEVYWADSRSNRDGMLLVNPNSLPAGWYRGHEYMSEKRTVECEVCSLEAHY